MRKIIISIFVLTIIILSTGCDNGKISNKKLNSPYTVDFNKNYFDYSLTGDFNGLNYRYDKDADVTHYGSYTVMDYKDKKDTLFTITMYYFQNISKEQLLEGNQLNSKGNKNYHDKSWNYYEKEEENGSMISNFVTQVGNNTYTITFSSKKDIHDFIDTFMNIIKFD